MSREYLTSDLHLLHTNIIKYAERKKYQSTDESCEKMSWNIVHNGVNRVARTIIIASDRFYILVVESHVLSQPRAQTAAGGFRA